MVKRSISANAYLQPRFNLKKIGSIGKPISKGKFRILNNNGKEITQP